MCWGGAESTTLKPKQIRPASTTRCWKLSGVHLCASTKASEVAWQPHVCMSARACQSGRDRANHLVISSTPTDTGTQNGKPCHDSLSAVAKQECRWLACHPSDTKPIPGSILPHFSSSRWRPPCCPEATLKSIVGHSESDHHLTSTKVVRYRRDFGPAGGGVCIAGVPSDFKARAQHPNSKARL